MKVTTKTNRDGSEQVLLGAVIMSEKPSRKRAKPHDMPYSFENHRLREIEKIIRRRHGNGIPDPTGTDDTELCHAYLRAVAMTPASQSVSSWARVWAPWADPVVLSLFDNAASGRERALTADAVAKLLYVSLAERNELGLKTIGACDVSKAERDKAAADRKRERDRNRQEQKRRSSGMVDRKSHQASTLAATKPWEAEGISRRSWFYRQQKHCTALSRIEINPTGDNSVQIFGEPVNNRRSRKGQSRVAGLVAGLGDHPPAELQEAAPHGICDRVEEQAA